MPWWVVVLQIGLGGVVGVGLGAWLTSRRADRERQQQREDDSLHRLDDQLQPMLKVFSGYLEAPEDGLTQLAAARLLPMVLGFSATAGVALPDNDHTSAGRIAAPVRTALADFRTSSPAEVTPRARALISLVEAQRRLIDARLTDPSTPVPSAGS